jgi:hypothetical protein
MNDLEKRFMEDSEETSKRIGMPNKPIKKELVLAEELEDKVEEEVEEEESIEENTKKI